jgi:hypothetical protein
MGNDDMRYYETFYGIHTDDWDWTFGAFTDHHYVLVKEYINEGCSCTETSSATNIIEFLYPHHIKKKYFIEGVIEGHVTFACSDATAYICQYRVTVGKVNENTTKTELFTTGWTTVDKTLDWNSTYSIGEEIVLPFWIDAWEKEELGEFDRIYDRVKSTCTDDTNFTDCSQSACTNIILWHSNDSTWEDIKITIPLRL